MRKIVWCAVALLAVAGCGGKKKSKTTEVSLRPSTAPAARLKAEGDELAFRLSPGAPDTAGERVPPAKTTPLSPADTQALLARLPKMETEPDDEQDFALRARSLAPPVAGETVKTAFPPPGGPPPPEVVSGPLEVVRHAPDGEVKLAPNLSVTFSQPMVAVTSHAQAEKNIPVHFTPEVGGKWRWVGTKTIVFEPTRRFPMATKFTVEVPAGTAALGGGTLAKAASWSFQTPVPTVIGSYPQDGPVRRQPIIFVRFDQAIRPGQVLRSIKVIPRGGQAVATRLATDAEIAADDTLKQLVKEPEQNLAQGNAPVPGERRWVALLPSQPLPGDSWIEVAVGPGTPSAEGPLTTTEPHNFSFRTFGPMKISGFQCGWGRCQPGTPFQIEFSNPIDAKKFKPTMLKVEPAITNMKTAVYGDSLNIWGATKGRTTYKVTVAAQLPDQFGQTMGKPDEATFMVGSADPSLAAGGKNFVVLDPSAKPRFTIYTTNQPEVRVRLYRVDPKDLPVYGKWADEIWREDAPTTPPLDKVSEKVVKLDDRPDQMVETNLELTDVLKGGHGQVVILVEPTTQPKSRYERTLVHAWVQATQIGLDAFVDDGELVAWASSLKDGKPLEGVAIEVGEARAGTGADGLARLPLSQVGSRRNLLVARKGDDIALLPAGLHAWGFYWNDNGWAPGDRGDSLRWFVFDDRHMYKPGETVHLKGWLRRVDDREGGDLIALGTVPNVTYDVHDPRGNSIAKGTMVVNAAGGFDTTFKLPDAANLGWASVELTAATAVRNNVASHQFEVQEFRRPEFEVSAHASAGPHLVGGFGTFSVAAKYYSGGALPNAETTWRVSASAGSFTPPNQDEFSFGTWTPWWGYHGRGGYDDDGEWRGYRGPAQKELKGFTDSQGAHHLRVDFDAAGEPHAYTVTASAEVMDVNRQAWVATATTLVHPAAEYVGLRSPRTFVDKSQPIDIEAIVADLEGKRVSGRSIDMRAVRLDWEQVEGVWKEKEVDAQTCKKSSAAEPVKCSFRPRDGGTHRIRATIKDTAGRENRSELTIWVSGGEEPPQRDVEQQKVTLIPDQKEYQPGQSAELLVQAPWPNAEGVMTLRRSGIVKAERFTIKGTSHKLVVPIEEAYLPGIEVQVDLVGAALRVRDDGRTDAKLPPRPAYATGSLTLPVPPRTRTLKVVVKPKKTALDPGGETAVDVEVVDAAGKPVAGAEVAVVVVDEAILALSGYQIGDPTDSFYGSRAGGGRDHHQRGALLLANPDKVAADVTNATGTKGGLVAPNMPAPPPGAAAAAKPALEEGRMGKKDKSGGEADGRFWGLDRGGDDELERNQGGKGKPDTPIAQRSNFDPLATFAAAQPTDAAGRVSVPVKLPDNLTRYRVTAVVVEGERRFGRGESQITARLPLMLRPSAPRFLNFGDQFELPVVIENQTEEPLAVDVAVRASNATLTAGAGRRLSIPGGDRVEVRFPVSAEKAGTARFQVGVAAGTFADAASVELPVWTPATTEAFATYGDVAGDKGSVAIKQPVQAPPDVWTQFGGLEITTSSTQLQALTDAVLYLVAYPYECAEQLSSRVLAVAALKDVLGAFKAPGLPAPDKILARMSKDLERLRGMQNSDGGFGFWKRGDDSWPFISIHVTHALSRAKDKGFQVNAEMLRDAQGYLKDIESHYPWYYSPETRRVLTSYALYVRNRLGDRDAKRAEKLIEEAGGLDGLGAEAVGWLWPVLRDNPSAVASIRTWVNNHSTEEAGTAHFVTAYGDGAHLLLASDRRADGILLESMIEDQPQSDLIAKVVRGLLAHRKRGAWQNTQENSFVLLALDKYFHVYEKTTPNFVARVWLGEDFAGDHAFRGRTTERHQIDIPMRQLAARAGQQDITVAKEGGGRLYYRIGMRYAPKSLALPPSEHGFTVERVYEAVDNAGDVSRDSTGTWHVKAGAKVRVRLTMVAQARRYHVALVDQLPAGLEPMNPALAVTGAIPAEKQERTGMTGGGRHRTWEEDWWWWRGTWYEHQNMRDERVEAFSSLLWEGVHTYSYVARATTPGRFVVPPAKAEEMYAPETFGRSASDALVVE